jgi:hypothetical protein
MMIGFALAAVGLDSITGQLRLTFGLPQLCLSYPQLRRKCPSLNILILNILI